MSMSHGEEKAKRWRFSIRRLIGLVTCVAVSFGLMNFANAMERIHQIQDLSPVLIGWSGIALLFGSTGGFCGQLRDGTTRSYRIGFICGLVTIVPSMLVIGTIVAFF